MILLLSAAVAAVGSDHDIAENAVERRVDAVIDDLTKGRVVPAKVDQLADAVARSRLDASIGRAINRSVGHTR